MDNLKYLQYFLIPILVPILIPIIFSVKNNTSTKILVTVLATIIGSSVIPLYPLNGNNENLISILDLILKGHNTALAIMLGAYLLTLILLAIPGHKLDKAAFGTYIVGFIALWVGLFTPMEYADISKTTSLVWACVYVLAPMLNLIFFLPLIFSEKTQKQMMQHQLKKQKERAKIPLIKEVLPLLIMFIPLSLYVVGTTYLYDKYHCFDSQTCNVWGSYLSRSALFWLSGFFFFVTITIAIGKGVLRGEAKGARYLIPFVFILFLLGNYAGFQDYVKTNEQGIEGNNYLGNNNITVKWEQIKSLGVNTNLDRGKCETINLYFELKNGSKVELSTIVNNDRNFFEYLIKQKNIKFLESTKCQ